jgi:hypothetical protein
VGAAETSKAGLCLCAFLRLTLSWWSQAAHYFRINILSIAEGVLSQSSLDLESEALVQVYRRLIIGVDL